MKPADDVENLQQQIASLTPAQRAMLEQWLRMNGGQAPAVEAIPRVADRRSAPLSFAQQRLWFLDQLTPGNSAYTMGRSYRIRGALDDDALSRSVTAVVDRHEALRTTFQVVGDQPIQRIEPSRPIELTVMDVDESVEPERESRLHASIAQARRPFELEHGPPLRVSLIRVGEEDHVLVLAMHHIVSDGWSMGILVRELAAYYEEFSGGRRAQLAELPIQYGDFAQWQREWLSGAVLEEQLEYWRRQLSGLPVLKLATDRPRPPMQSFRGGRVSVLFSRDLMEGLRELSRREGATLYMALLAGFGALLGRYTGQQDVVVGSFIAGRNRSEIEGLIGFFVNTLVMRMNLAEDPTFRELLRHVREVALGAWAHQDLPFERLVEELHPERSLAQNPLVQTTLTLQNAPVTQLDLPGIVSTPVDVETTATRFDLEVYLTERPDGLTCAFVYATDLFDPSTIVRMLGHYERLLQDVVSDAGRRISELSLLPEAELRLILKEWNRTDAEYPREKTVHRLFEEQAERTPEATAVVFEGSQLTYGELNRRSNELALRLRALGVGPEVLVGICLERSLEMLTTIFGILKAGGGYLPLDPGYPDERLAFMLQDARPAVVVTERPLANRL
ncbi:MAG: condensation domain-containing protein, partial [Acidobacteriota bacterium]